MKSKKLILASSIAMALALPQLGSASIEAQDEQDWLRKQMGTVKSEDQVVAYYVRYNEKTKNSVQSALIANGAKINHHLERVNTYSVTLPANQVSMLNTIAGVEFMEPVPEKELMAQVVPWNIDQFQARDVWDVDRDGNIDPGAPDGSGVKFCIIDTGFYAAHDDFQGITHTGASQIIGEAYTEDGNGHGTHVAGTANAVNNNIGVVGVMPGGAELHIIKIFNNAGDWVVGQSDLGAAATACKDAGANAISMSLGGGSSATEEAVFQDLYDNFNIISIAAAGNDGNNVASYPASYDSVVSVGALDENENWANFSQFPATSYDPNNPPANVEWDVVELSGGGANVLSTYPTPDGNVPVYNVNNDGIDYSANQITETAAGDVTANLVEGGLCDAGDVDPSWNGSVVLCERGDIAFADKMNNVASNGGVAAIIYNNAAGNFNGTCGGNCTSGATIPGVSLSQADGQTLQNSGLGLPTNVLVDDGSGCVGCSGGYAYLTGTSMATPGVAAGIAWAWDACGGPAGITNKELRQLLRDSAKDLDDPDYDVRTGFGLVQLRDALELGNQRFGSTCPIGLSATPTEIEVCTLPTANDAVYTVTLSDDFMGTSNMSATGVPAGAIGTFNPVQVVFPATTSDFTVSNLDSLASGTHALALTATDDSDPNNNASANVTLITFDAMPGTANLTSPADAATGVSGSAVSYAWDAVSGASEYFIEISDDSGFGNIIESATVDTNAYTGTIALESNTQYYWRVSASNVCGDGVTSATFSFTTSSELCFSIDSAITDNNPAGDDFGFSVADSGTLDSLTVSIDASHTWVGDLIFTLSKDATSVILMDRPGFAGTGFGCSGDNVDAIFDDNSGTPVEDECDNLPAIGGTVAPQEALSAFSGTELSGNWTINVSDNVSADTGTMNEICLMPVLGGSPVATAVDDNATVLEDDGAQAINVMNNDTNAGASTITAITQGSNGTVTIAGGNTSVSYDPNSDYCGSDSFTYTLDGSSTATVNVTVDCVNDQPDFMNLASVDVNNADIGNPPATVVACSFDMGAADEDISQSVNDFIVTIDSDPNGILSTADVLNDGSLSATYSGNLGTAVINVSMQDDGGTANSGIDTSTVKQVEINVTDMIFNHGFEASVPPVTCGAP